jgi:mono/diheme cytochrome c family protein
VVAPTNKTSNTLNSKELVQEVDGKQLFMMNCATCHHPTRNSIESSIYDVKSRWKNKKLLYAYTRNSTEVIKKMLMPKHCLKNGIKLL